VQTLLVAYATQLAPHLIARPDDGQLFASRRIADGAAPPGGTLVAQHTSLLL